MKVKGSQIKIFVFSLCWIFVAGCATVGSEFQFQGPDSIEIGKTSQGDILAKFGKPFRVGYSRGSEKWTYGYYKYKLFGDSQTKDLDISFDKSGIGSDYVYSSSQPEEVNRATQK
jgi:hypothetical protein